MSDAFDIGWLALRAPFDAAAQARPEAVGLAAAFGARMRGVRERGALRLIDLGGGTGANICRLAPRIPGSQDWLLVDDDAALLAGVPATLERWARRIGGRFEATEDSVSIVTPQRIVTVRRQRYDLRGGLAGLPLDACDGVAAAALLDLVSRDWVDAAAAALAARRLPALFTLTAVGAPVWQPATSDDADIAAAFARDLRRDKGFGPALGGRAADGTAAALGACGYAVRRAASDWDVGAHADALLLALLDVVARAAARQPPRGGDGSAWAHRVAAWRADRRAAIARRELTASVAHADLLASL